MPADTQIQPGNPRQVIPVLQSQTRGNQTLTLIALERWTSAIFATIELVDRTPDSDVHRIVTAEFTADLRDDRGTLYQARSSGGGAGGGPGIMTSHARIGFAPVPRAGSSLTMAVSTHFTEHIHPAVSNEQGWVGHSPTGEERTWSDPAPWVFALNMPEHSEQGRTLTGEPPAPPPITRKAKREFLGDIGERRRIIPVLQTRTVGDRTFTVIALEIGDAGLHMICRMLQRRPRRGHFDEPIRCSVADDRGNGYAVWPGHGSGQPASYGTDWWMAMTVLPALDPAATALFIAMEALKIDQRGSPRVGGLLDWEETSRWLFCVPLERS